MSYEILDAFMGGFQKQDEIEGDKKPKKTIFGNYRIEGDTLLYRAQSSKECRDFRDDIKKLKAELKKLDGKLTVEGKPYSLTEVHKKWPYNLRIQYYETNTIAKRITRDGDVVYLGNDSILPLVGRTVSYGNEELNCRVTEIQKCMNGYGFIMLQFDVIGESKLHTFKRIEQGAEETHKIKILNPKWDSYDKNSRLTKYINQKNTFVGTALFTVGGNTFLYDLDRREIKNKNYKTFLVKLPASVRTIAEAYESLKPKEVIEAEAKGQAVLRQGKIFYVPTETPAIPVLSDAEKILILASESYVDESIIETLTGLKKLERRGDTVKKLIEKVPRSISLLAGSTTEAKFGIILDGITYVTGEVTRAKCCNMNLQGWYIAIPNTACRDLSAEAESL